MMNWLTENWMVCGMALTSVIGSASVAAAAVAKLTRNKTDDKVAAALLWVYRKLRAVGLNSLAPPK